VHTPQRKGGGAGQKQQTNEQQGHSARNKEGEINQTITYFSWFVTQGKSDRTSEDKEDSWD